MTAAFKSQLGKDDHTGRSWSGNGRRLQWTPKKIPCVCSTLQTTGCRSRMMTITNSTQWLITFAYFVGETFIHQLWVYSWRLMCQHILVQDCWKLRWLQCLSASPHVLGLAKSTPVPFLVFSGWKYWKFFCFVGKLGFSHKLTMDCWKTIRYPFGDGTTWQERSISFKIHIVFGILGEVTISSANYNDQTAGWSPPMWAKKNVGWVIGDYSAQIQNDF